REPLTHRRLHVSARRPSQARRAHDPPWQRGRPAAYHSRSGRPLARRDARSLRGRAGLMCGVFGIYAPGEPVARLTYFGIYALQHRGQESAGIVAADERHGMSFHRNMGLVSQVFDEQSMADLTGDIAIGHTRYSTSGSSA